MLIQGMKHWLDIILQLRPGVGSGETERFARGGGLRYMQIRERPLLTQAVEEADIYVFMHVFVYSRQRQLINPGF